MTNQQQEPILQYQQELNSEVQKTFGFNLYQGQPYIMSFRDLLNDMLKAGVELGALKVLFKYCRAEDKTHPNYFRVVVNNWLEEGIKTSKQAKQALEYNRQQSGTTICNQPQLDCLNNKCELHQDCPVFKVVNYFNQQVNPEVIGVSLQDKRLIENRLNSIFTVEHLIQAIDNFAKSDYRQQGETRLSFIFNSDSYTKDWVNKVIDKPSPNGAADFSEQKKQSTLGQNLSAQESKDYLNSLFELQQEGDQDGSD